MDIFTTQLTRVVPVPIKPADLKVKALLKEAATGKLKEDLLHMENHEYYFVKPKYGEPQQGQPGEQQEATDKKQDKDNIEVDEQGNKIKHLDIYV